MGLTEIEHSSHPQHKLKLQRPSEPYICSGCLEQGFGTCYECKACNFYIHKECALPSPNLFHRFFRHCDFEFHQAPPSDRICDACTKDIKGCAYQCTCKSPYDLHPCCAKLPDTLRGENVTLKLTKKIPSNCFKCHSKKKSRRGVNGWSYVSSCGKYCFHVACVKEMVYEAWEDGYFNQESSSDRAANYNVSDSGLQITALQSYTSMDVDVGGEKSVGGKFAGKLKTVVSVLTLIISAIFGDPVTACAKVILAIASSLASN